ncbi:hypothetical protein V8E36_007560 [Tilletia maclaganii]
MEPLTRIFANGTEGSTFKVASDVSSTPVLAGVLTVLATLVFYQFILAPPATLRPKGSKIRPIFSWLPFLGSVDFYDDRVGFLRKHFGNPEAQSFHGGARRITVRNDPVILLAGDKPDAKTFFFSRNLKFVQAYHRLLSGVPREITASASADVDKADALFKDNLKQAIRGERLAKLAPAMCEDTLRALRAVPDWSKGEGVMDPKPFTFPLLFCMSMRTVGFSELADQPNIMEELANYYWTLERNTTYWSTFFAKYPFSSSRLKKKSGDKLFAALTAAANRRQEEGIAGDDAVAMLMDKGFDADYAVRFVVTSLFAAIINSTSMSLWLLLYLGANPEIRKRAHKEVVDHLDGMAATQGPDWKSKPRVEQLQALSLDEWEHGFPLIEACLKETMRTALEITLFRLNMGDKKGGTAAPKVHGEEVRTGEFLGYWMGSTHFDSKIYSNPHRWDPERWARGEGSGDMDFLGWGAGMHPCTGMRFAKLEIKNFITTILALMDWETIEPRTGEVHTLDTLPDPEYNANDRSPAVPVSIRFQAY